ncbi:uncharacterized protein LOC111088859 isoform X2 [Limulus polyphemus]|nr:uncharacterized protein LOC111088859 isoform X2 [Limulus polyphemus]XP_022255699.1 uncharacterized protein LOC111088859 isoform X2 [Limulus polyphemus]XP_022255700.1 uncharacterized protein LOC111088859 isoform X2 [Limulus polyphemus]
MRNPRLPGMERLKFNIKEGKLSKQLDESSGFIRNQNFRKSCPIMTSTPEKLFRRRKPFLPITSRNTSRVLNNSDLELSVEGLDLSSDDNSLAVNTSTRLIPLSSDRKIGEVSSSRRISLPIYGSLRMRRSHQKFLEIHEAFSDVRLLSDTVSECVVDGTIHQPSPNSPVLLNREFDWKNYRSSTHSSRMSTSSQSSYTSEDEVWIPRKHSV